MAVKNIKLSIDAPLLSTEGAVTHTATSWQVSKLPNFGLDDHIVMESLLDSVDLLERRFSYDMQANESLYIRTKYHFNDGKNSAWSKIIPLNPAQTGIKMSTTIVNTPKVTVNLDYSNNLRGDVLLTSSVMSLYGGIGTHVSTTWEIVDVDGNVFFYRSQDTDNLVSMRVALDSLPTDKAYVVKVTHHTNTNAVSNQGKAILNTSTGRTSLFSVKSPYTLKPNKWLYFELKLYTTEFKSVDIILVDDFGNVIVSNLEQTSRFPRIYTGDLQEYNRYTIKARLNLVGNESTDYRRVTTSMIRPNYLIDYRTDLTYLNRMTYTQPLILGGGTVQVTRELESGAILLGKHGSDSLFNYKLINGKLTETHEVLNLGIDGVLGKPYINITPMTNGKVVVDYAGGESGGVYRQPTFKVFEHNPITQSLVLVSSRERTDERYSTAVSTSAVGVGEMLYYIPAEVVVNGELTNLTIRRLNTTTNELLSEEIALPFEATSHVCLASVEDDGLYVIGGGTVTVTSQSVLVPIRSNNIIWRYDLSTGAWSEITTLPDVPTDRYCFQAATRRDRKIVLFNGSSVGGSVGDQSTILFDPITKTTTLDSNDFADNLAYRNVVSLLSGDVVRISSRTIDPQKAYTYISDTMVASSIVDNTLVDVITDLVIPIGQTITIESPYRFDTIVVQGDSDYNTGTLQWLDGDVMRTFMWNDLIITRPTEYTEDLYVCGRVWNSVTILDDASLDISNVIHVPENRTFVQVGTISVSEITVGIGGDLTIEY